MIPATDKKNYYKHHYWELPIVIYLFVGGLAGGMMFLSWVLSAFVFPGEDLTGLLLCPMLVALVVEVIGLACLVGELGQPPVFWRVYSTATSIIKWGAVLLTIAAIGAVIWIVAYIPWEWLAPLSALCKIFAVPALAAAGVTGLGIMIYTGIMLSTLKAHAFWATPALPALFTTSALSTGCAAILLSIGFWPAVNLSVAELQMAVEIKHLLHYTDIILVFVELTILLIMVLSFLGAGNKTAARVAKRWVAGSMAPFFWGGMIAVGLVIPQLMNLSGIPGTEIASPVLVLIGGFILRCLCVYSDDRAPLPGEQDYYARLPKDDARFLTAWKDGEMMY